MARSFRIGLLALGLVVFAASPARAAVSLGGVMAFSPDDISVANILGLLTFSGDDVVQNATLPFTFTVEGVGYTTIAMSTNGWLELGGNTALNSHPANDCLPTASAGTNAASLPPLSPRALLP